MIGCKEYVCFNCQMEAVKQVVVNLPEDTNPTISTNIKNDIDELHNKIEKLIPAFQEILPLAKHVFNNPELREAMQSPSLENLGKKLQITKHTIHHGLEAYYLFHMLQNAIPALEQVNIVTERLLK